MLYTGVQQIPCDFEMIVACLFSLLPYIKLKINSHVQVNNAAIIGANLENVVSL